ncbi:MAG: response regulator [bacterium]
MAKKKRVLIVDDDHDMHVLYKDMFEGENEYEIELEDNGFKALEKIKETHYDLLILDIIMEPFPGDSVFVSIRDNDKLKDLPIIVVSVLDHDSLALLKRFGQANFLKKPIKKEELMDEIKKVLS